MKKMIRNLAAALLAAALLVSTSFAAPPAGDAPPTGDGGFNIDDFVTGGDSGPAQAYGIEDFTDSASIQNQEAVTALVELGLLNGIEQADKSLQFKPAGTLTRGQMAKLASMAVTLISGEAIEGKAAFADTTGSWAKDYVAYCADKGMIDGYGNGTFGPNNNVTGVQLAKILLAAMGVKDGLTGDGWADNVSKLAGEKGLLEGITADMGKEITRDNAALLIYNALKASDGTAALPKLTLAKAGSYDELAVGRNELLMAPGKDVTLLQDGKSVNLDQGRTYKNVTVAVTEQNQVLYGGRTTSKNYNFRQGIYAGKNGYDESKSLTGLVTAGTVGKTSAEGVKIGSDEKDLKAKSIVNGIYVEGGTYTVKDATIELNGNGSNDFVGYGAALMASNGGTLVVDGATVNNQGAMRTAGVVDKGGKLIVKNSTLTVKDGQLPADYVPTYAAGEMLECPWMTGSRGNNRATNLLGTDSLGAYINTTVTADNWGLLSSDNCTRGNIVGINSTLKTESEVNGYGNLVIGSAVGTFLGTTVNVGGYGSYIMSGDITYGDSTVEAVKALNERLGLGLTDDEIAKLGEKNSTVEAGRSAILQTGAGKIDISGKTSLTSRWAVFAIKGAASSITVDGSKGATLKSTEDNVILQLMDNDDPGDMNGSYTDKTTTPAKDASHDVTKATAGSDVIAAFKSIDLVGDFFNSVRGDQSGGIFSPGNTLRNLSVSLDGSTLTGQITASTALHKDGQVTKETYYELGHVTNTACAAINNGVLVELKNASAWTVTETSYLTSLTIGTGCSVSAPSGKTLTMTVDGVETPITAGQTYTGAIVLTVK